MTINIIVLVGYFWMLVIGISYSIFWVIYYGVEYLIREHKRGKEDKEQQ